MVFYRKYRSQNLDELVGQEGVKQSLKLAFLKGSLAHAYLLVGPRGTGKTSTARILAKMVNCEAVAKDSYNPCNNCSACLAITEGTHLDIIEMDAASNRGIEDIRSLRDNIKLAPSSARKKVYIVDEVHMLTGDAFNALLKTLEEPPGHVLFILATTEVQKIPVTILSRVQKLDFKAATAEELMQALKKVADAEKLEIDEGALLLLSKRAQGSFRDGIKFLDQLSSVNQRIDQRIVEENLGIGVFEGVVKILDSIAQGGTKEALEKVHEQVDKGVHVKELIINILDLLRQLLLIKNGLGPELIKIEVGSDRYPELLELSKKLPPDCLLFIINAFQKSFEQGRFVSIPLLPLEVAVVESCICSEGLKTEFDSIKIKSDLVKTEFDSVKTKELNNSDNPASRSSGTSSPSPELSSSGRMSESFRADDIQKITDKWGYVLETVRQYNFSLEALLRSSQITNCSEKSIVIEVPYSFHQRIIEAPKSRDILESIFSDILGRSVKVTTTLGQKQVKKDDVANIEIAQDDEIIRLAAEIFNSETVS